MRDRAERRARNASASSSNLAGGAGRSASPYAANREGFKMGSSSPRDAPRLGGSLPRAPSRPSRRAHQPPDSTSESDAPSSTHSSPSDPDVDASSDVASLESSLRRPRDDRPSNPRPIADTVGVDAPRAMPTPRVFRPSRDDRRGGCLRFARGGEVNAIYVTFLLHRRRGHKWNRTRSNHARDDHKGYPLAVCIFDYGPFPPSRSRGPTSSLCSPSANARINPAFPMWRAPFIRRAPRRSSRANTHRPSCRLLLSPRFTRRV